jgi:hypothetical protein
MWKFTFRKIYNFFGTWLGLAYVYPETGIRKPTQPRTDQASIALQKLISKPEPLMALSKRIYKIYT